MSNWRPQCYVCGRFVRIEAYDVGYDYYSGGWEEGYTACPDHGGPSLEECRLRRARELVLQAYWAALDRGELCLVRSRIELEAEYLGRALRGLA